MEETGPQRSAFICPAPVSAPELNLLLSPCTQFFPQPPSSDISPKPLWLCQPVVVLGCPTAIWDAALQDSSVPLGTSEPFAMASSERVTYERGWRQHKASLILTDT